MCETCPTSQINSKAAYPWRQDNIFFNFISQNIIFSSFKMLGKRAFYQTYFLTLQLY